MHFIQLMNVIKKTNEWDGFKSRPKWYTNEEPLPEGSS